MTDLGSMRVNLRVAIVGGSGATPEVIAKYLPGNYQVDGIREDGMIVISGVDRYGWTLDDYVIPRLASGLYFCKEVS